jgi:hypothetical protein
MKKLSKDANELAESLDRVLAAFEKSSDRRERKPAEAAMVLQIFSEELAKIEDAALLKSMGIGTLEDEETNKP